MYFSCFSIIVLYFKAAWDLWKYLIRDLGAVARKIYTQNLNEGKCGKSLMFIVSNKPFTT